MHLVQNPARTLAPRDDLPAVRPEARDHADKLRRPLLVRHVLHIFQQVFHPLRIRIFVSVARGIDARRAVERVDHQARIVGQHRQPGRFHDRLGLEQRVFLKRRARLLDLDIKAVFRFQRDLKAQLPQNGGQFFELVRVFAC